MPEIKLSDGQTVKSETIEKVELSKSYDLLITTKEGAVKVHGPSAKDDADLLDDIRDKQHLNYLVFRPGVSK